MLLVTKSFHNKSEFEFMKLFAARNYSQCVKSLEHEWKAFFLQMQMWNWAQTSPAAPLGRSPLVLGMPPHSLQAPQPCTPPPWSRYRPQLSPLRTCENLSSVNAFLMLALQRLRCVQGMSCVAVFLLVVAGRGRGQGQFWCGCCCHKPRESRSVSFFFFSIIQPSTFCRLN